MCDASIFLLTVHTFCRYDLPTDQIADSRGYYPGDVGYLADMVPSQRGQSQKGQGPYTDGGGNVIPDGYGGFVRRPGNPRPPEPRKPVRLAVATSLSPPNVSLDVSKEKETSFARHEICGTTYVHRCIMIPFLSCITRLSQLFFVCSAVLCRFLPWRSLQ